MTGQRIKIVDVDTVDGKPLGNQDYHVIVVTYERTILWVFRRRFTTMYAAETYASLREISSVTNIETGDESTYKMKAVVTARLKLKGLL